ncbi:MAG: nicotinamide riboside transporter PnuC [Crocinitomicaceae bacterium]
MNEFFIGLKEAIVNTPLLEWIAVFTGVAYVILAAKKSIWCWSFAMISSTIFVYLCFDAQLYIEAALQLFYVAMAVIGWWMWNKAKNDRQFIVTWPISSHLINIVASLIVSFTLGFILDTYTDQAQPYADSFTTIFSLAATFMVTKRVLNNWLYWIVIDLVSVHLYYSRGLELSSVLYIVFTILAIFAWLNWKKQYKLQTE